MEEGWTLHTQLLRCMKFLKMLKKILYNFSSDSMEFGVIL